MLNTGEIFKNRRLKTDGLKEYGFDKEKDCYRISWGILDNQFRMDIFIKENELPQVKVIDSESGEEYTLIHNPKAGGSFVGEVVSACEEKLREIAEKCYDYEIFKSSQMKEIIAYAEEKYHNHPEFLWKKTPNNAVLRRSDTNKWYAALLTVEKNKIGLEGEGTAEIVDLHGKPEEIAGLIDGGKYLPGYHMNKKSWYTICLDGRVDTREILSRIDESFLLAKK